MAIPRATPPIRSGRQKDRGAVLVEAALAIPFLILLIFGAIEAGMAWEARSSSTSGVRTGLLRAAQLGDKPETDLRILQSVVGEIGADKVGNIEYIVIFDATDPNHAGTIANCAAAIAGGGLSTTCNTYSNAQLVQIVNASLTITNFDNGTGGDPGAYVCDSSKVDSNWCPGSRLGVNNAINVGVAVRYDHSWFTGILPGDGVEFTEFAISSTLVGDQAAPLYTVPPPPPPPTTTTTAPQPTTTTTAAPTTTTTAAPPAPDSYSPESIVLSGDIETGDEDGYDYAEMEEGSDYSEPGDSSIDIGFTVEQEATFYLTALVWHWDENSGSRDSFWIVIDGDTDGALAWHIGSGGDDEWLPSTNSPSFDLTPGSYTISLHTREKYSRIATDTIQLNAV